MGDVLGDIEAEEAVPGHAQRQLGHLGSQVNRLPRGKLFELLLRNGDQVIVVALEARGAELRHHHPSLPLVGVALHAGEGGVEPQRRAAGWLLDGHVGEVLEAMGVREDAAIVLGAERADERRVTIANGR